MFLSVAAIDKSWFLRTGWEEDPPLMSTTPEHNAHLFLQGSTQRGFPWGWVCWGGEQAVLLVETGSSGRCWGLPQLVLVEQGEGSCPADAQSCGHHIRQNCKTQFPLHLAGMRCVSPEGSQHWGAASGTHSVRLQSRLQPRFHCCSLKSLSRTIRNSGLRNIQPRAFAKNPHLRYM